MGAALAGPDFLSPCESVGLASSSSKSQHPRNGGSRSRLASGDGGEDDGLEAVRQCARSMFSEVPPPESCDDMDDDEIMPVHPIAVCQKKVDFICEKRLLDAEGEDQLKTQLLHQALRSGDFVTTVRLVEAGADVCAKTLRGLDALMLASGSRGKGSEENVKFLLDACLSIESRDKMGWTPLMHASRVSSRLTSAMLLDHSADVHAADALGRTSLMFSCIEGALDLVQILVERGASVRQQDARGWSALFYAAERGNSDILKWLLRKKANPNQVAKDKATSLLVAAVHGHITVAKQLLRRGGDYDHSDKHGNNALILSLVAGQDLFSTFIMDEGCEVDSRNKDGLGAFEIADVQGFQAQKHRIFTIQMQRAEAQKKAALEERARAGQAARANRDDDY